MIDIFTILFNFMIIVLYCFFFCFQFHIITNEFEIINASKTTVCSIICQIDST